jgi:FKBP-type peptidyl-prolyl cis-trans isomerase
MARPTLFVRLFATTLAIAAPAVASAGGDRGTVAPAEASAPAPADVSAPPSDAIVTSSGLAYRVLVAGGRTDHPTALSTATLDFTLWSTDGTLLDASSLHGGAATFPLKAVIPGFSEGVQLLAPGDTARLWVPEALAYRGAEGKPAGMLVFDVTLRDFTSPPAAPADVAAAPENATRTPSGLAYVVLEPGRGTKHPKPTSTVTVHYTGWLTDGSSFDSSISRGRPLQARADRLIAGWTEGLQTMVVGETTRFWIPEALAYQGRPGMPPGMLVFDVTLLAIEGRRR